MFSGNPIQYQDVPLTNDGFWPDLNLADFQKARSIPADVAAETVAEALITAVAEVNGELAGIQDKHRAAGCDSADAVPGGRMKGMSQLTAQYKKAVYARAKADLMGEFASVGRRESHPGQESGETRNGLLAEAAMVIRQIKGLKRATVRMV
ncbi:capsid completion protein [Klebsiella variicola]|uniref:head completion/stabilization protein n=1 Tax=Klebsiella variicola TaxID=244366 RepID=UPI000D747A67|nr:head completion/stabilization protein [Klebsiella variicola]PXH33326.1 head completion protein [Klebsiella variicola]SXD75639.1 capsid completion protein [Klebsiella variicola]HCT8728685.1 head completion/stabilization protein [Klebsiella pneumoniae]